MQSCDIIIPVWNQLEATKSCLDSIKKNTKYPYRLIIVDNASEPDTQHYLEGFKKAEGASVQLIRNYKNLGFIKAVNQAMASSRAPYLCLLNNDTIVTEGWLAEMVAVAETEKEIGVVNPSSNNLGQRPAGGQTIEAFAFGLKAMKGQFVELGSAIGFCMLIKREVIDRIGFFDEVYGMGNFEDTDFCRRAVKEGYRCVRACASYVYHKENSSFIKLKTYDEDFKRNKEIFEFRWGAPKRLAYIVDEYDKTILMSMANEAVKLARLGNWVWYFTKDEIEVPRHSNIVLRNIGPEWFYPRVVFEVLKKKKKFNQIFVSGKGLGNILEKTAFLHKAAVKYY